MELPPFNRYLGIRVVRHEPGSAVLELELEPHHLNRRGVAHGGVVVSLLDSALGGAVIAAIPEAWWCATTSLDTQFVGGAGGGTLTATGRLRHRGARIAFAEGEVRDAQGRLVAAAQGTWHLWPRKPGAVAPEPHLAHEIVGPDGRPVPVGKIVAVGRNYAAHVAEMGAPPEAPPVIFLKPPTALLPGGGVLRVPTDAGAVHHEVELVALIGVAGKAIDESSALDHVAGFAVGLDLTLRDVQAEAKRTGGPWTVSKGFDGSAPVSAAVAREAVGDGSGLAITLDVNGARVQQGNTSAMLHPVARLVAEVSRRMTLEPGDLLFTGTPEGVGPLRPGDRAVAAIEKVGTLELAIEADAG